MRNSNFCFTFVKSKKNGIFCPFLDLTSKKRHHFELKMEIKDRIRSIMEDQKMTQQEFADFLQQSPATLSSIFNGRTNPTLKVVDAIKTKIPDISIEWLLYGTGEMYISHPESPQESNADFGGAPDLFSAQYTISEEKEAPVKTPNPEIKVEKVKIVEKEPRRVTEIRVYYDDQTYETFIPAKK